MVPVALTIFGLVVGALLLLLYAPVGIPIIVIALIGLVVALTRSRKGGEPLGTVERSKRGEPTGRPRPATTGPETANHRQGQV